MSDEQQVSTCFCRSWKKDNAGIALRTGSKITQKLSFCITWTTRRLFFTDVVRSWLDLSKTGTLSPFKLENLPIASFLQLLPLHKSLIGWFGIIWTLVSLPRNPLIHHWQLPGEKKKYRKQNHKHLFHSIDLRCPKKEGEIFGSKFCLKQFIEPFKTLSPHHLPDTPSKKSTFSPAAAAASLGTVLTFTTKPLYQHPQRNVFWWVAKTLHKASDLGGLGIFCRYD